MTIEYTLSIIKPDATRRNIIGKINTYFENGGLEIVAQKMLILSKEQVQKFYAEHKERPFFDNLVNTISSGNVVLQVLKGVNAIAKNREIMGATNPADASDGTIRKDCAISIDENSVHGSDSINSAKREINFFFSEIEICK